MRKTLHLHVGLPKCGSTSLQEFLRSNRSRLREQGFDYPLTTDRHIGNLKPYAKSVFSTGDDTVFRHYSSDVRLETAVEDLWAAVSQSDAPNVILSAEGIYNQRDTAKLSALTDRFEAVRIHMVFRPKVEWVVSHYAQGVKAGRYDAPLEHFVQRDAFRRMVLPKMAFADHVEFWRSRYGADNVSIHFAGRRFASVVNQFLVAAGLDLSEPDNPLRKNKSPSAFVLSALVATARTSQKDFLVKMKSVVRHATALDPDPKKHLLSRAVVDLLDPLLRPDSVRLAAIQDVITLDDLMPDYSRVYADAASFSDMVATEAFEAVKKKVGKDRIELTNLPPVGPLSAEPPLA